MIVGLRGWSFNDRLDLPGYKTGDAILRSPVWGSYRWEGPVFHSDHRPERWNNSGIYSVNERGASRFCNEGPFGLVAPLGHTIVHELGYRSESARIEELYIPSHQRSIKAALEDRYQCDVLLFKYGSLRNEFALERMRSYARGFGFQGLIDQTLDVPEPIPDPPYVRLTKGKPIQTIAGPIIPCLGDEGWARLPFFSTGVLAFMPPRMYKVDPLHPDRVYLNIEDDTALCRFLERYPLVE